MFNEYQKIKTLFKLIPLDEKGKKWDATSGEILPETAALHYYPLEELIFTEKIDGTNMGIRVDNKTLTHIQKRNNICDIDNGDKYYLELGNQLIDNILKVDMPINKYIIYGELCGVKIQKGGNYFNERRFLIFDIYDLENNKYFTWDALNYFTNEMGLEVVPKIQYTKDNLQVENVKDFIMNLKSYYNENFNAEGFVVRHSKDTHPDRRWIAKIRRKDFKIK